MKKSTLASILFVSLFASGQTTYSQKLIKHYIFFSKDREMIHDSSFYSISGIDGAQITYAWKQLFIQIQDVTFSSSRVLTPNYMLDELRELISQKQP